MPLDPKQLPPYYTPGTTPTPGGQTKFLRLNAQFAAIQTSGTTETDLYTYTLPANTLTQNGDGLLIQFSVVQSTTAEDHIIRFKIAGTTQQSVNDLTNTFLMYEITLVRISSSELYTIARSWSATTIGTPNQQIANTLDFTNTIQLKFTGQCTGTAVIETELMTIDKQLI